jgi:CubicO group peptidase (beta-lactamase class C family)
VPRYYVVDAYGLSGIESGKPPNVDTVYRIGSMTKQFTALMLLQLAEQGKVRHTDPVEKYFPEVNRIAGRFPGAPPITLIQLATHYAGLAQEPDDTERFTTGAVSQWEQPLAAALPKLKYEHAPGTHFVYSNIGFAILGTALSRAAGQPYMEYVREHIFAPLGMVHTRFEPDEQMLTALAKGYMLRDGAADPKEPAKELKNGRGYKVPNGAVFSTVGDLARFISFEMGYGPATVLKKKTLVESQGQLFWAQPDATLGYGIGLILVRKGEFVGFGHGGSVAGFLAGAYFHPASHLGIISCAMRKGMALSLN